MERLAAAVRSAFGQYRFIGGRGIGGAAAYLEADAAFGVLDTARGPTTFGNPIAVALPTVDNWSFPSILGMNFLTYFDMHFNHNTSAVELEFIG